MEAIEIVTTLAASLAAVGVSGIIALLAAKFGTEIYSNIKQTLLERESSEDVQK